ncbi:hypothetical protein AYO22_04041 [Fonsecaea multimorphosa]|nr:hypothetical protein AYO22_04041 [Fonsecaea multimorphosa]
MSANAISAAFEAGIFEENASQNRGWTNLRPRIESMLEKADNRTTLFVGAAASSFKPTAYPTWGKFIELLYSSLIDVASAELENDRTEVRNELKQCIAGALQWGRPDRVPNYKVTEVIARRLGKDYLRLLSAFRTQQSDDGWLVNDAHRWVAKCLMDGSTAAAVTTNFDDCIERALENAQANIYRLTGNRHVDGPEIVERMQDTTKRLILVVSGPQSCQFAQALLPQLGKMVSLLFKLHGSCYEEESCIDTRLQRQQGLPSYAVDILDTLIKESVFFLVCYSGGDLNDNTDYLRMVHNKETARLVWLQKRFNEVEPGLEALSRVLQTADTADHGLCLLHGSMRGEQVEWDAEPPEFVNDVFSWSARLGSSWCKLVVLDLIELCNGASTQRLSLEKLGFSGSQRQDWNDVLEDELGEFLEQDQFVAARKCSNAAELLHSILADELDENQRALVCPQVNQQCSIIKVLHQSFNSNLDNQQSHAQSWVISSLYGLLLFCGKQQRAAGEALAFAQNFAYLVGDLQSSKLIEQLIHALKIKSRSKSGEQPTGQKREDSALTAFIPSLDNVNAKANLYGVPPSLFFRALLHRAMLFADRIAIPPQLLTNSKEFVGEVLFGGTDEAKTFYLSFLCPIVPETGDQDEARSLLSGYRRNTAGDFISEGFMESYVKKLEEYFHSTDNESRFIFYSRAGIADRYNQ